MLICYLKYTSDLQRKFFQNPHIPFGGVAVVLLGDIMQLPPIRANGSFVFSKTSNKDFHARQEVDDLWMSFDVILLKTNHRQGEDREYADFLNRVRLGRMTEEDKQLLRDRTFHRDDDCIPKDALLVAPTNAVVNKYNAERLNELPGELVQIQANVRKFKGAESDMEPRRLSFGPGLKISTIE